MASSSDPKDRRRSERVVLRMRIAVIAEDIGRKPQQFEVMTQVVNAHGGLMRTQTELHVGQPMLLNNLRTTPNKPAGSCASTTPPMAISQWLSSSPPAIPSFGRSFSHPKVGLPRQSEPAVKPILTRNSRPSAVFHRVIMVSARRTLS